MKVYICLVNWNGWRDTIECLESVFRVDYPDYRVIVCDNASEDDSLHRIKDWAEGRLEAEVSSENPLRELTHPPVCKPVKWVEYDRASAEAGGNTQDDAQLVLIQTGANLGFAGGNNVGLRYALARGDIAYAWLLNNDTVVKTDALSQIVQRMQENPKAGICGSTLLFYDKPDTVISHGGSTYNKWLGTSRHIGWGSPAARSIDAAIVERIMFHVSGASMLVSSEFLRDVGLMDENYFLYCEELDWAIRAQRRYPAVYAPGSVVYHKIGRSTGSGTGSRNNWAADARLLRNRIIITRRYFPAALPLVYAGLGVTLLNRVRRRQWMNLGRILKAILGGLDGQHK